MEQKILKLFLFEKRLRFSEISRRLPVRTNKLSYHIKSLVKKGILEKIEDYYQLSESAEHLIPYLSNKKAPLPVILIGIGNSKECFLQRRKKKPFLGKLGLPGGRMIIGENPLDSAKRIMKKKYRLNITPKKIASVSMEHVTKNKKLVHSFLIFFVTAITKEDLKLTPLSKNKKEIIKSDYQIISKDFDKEMVISNFNTSP